MMRVLDYAQTHWLALAALAAAFATLCLRLMRGRSTGYAPAALLLACGGLGLVPADWAGWLVAGAALILCIMLAVVFMIGEWWAVLGYVTGGMLVFGLGGWTLPGLTRSAEDAGAFLISLRPLQPAWLLLLAVLPVISYFGWRGLITLGATRRWLVLGLRCGLLLIVILALAETEAQRGSDHITVLFVWDRSLSVPKEFHGGIDVREERIRNFINQAVIHRGPARERDKTGLIVFGRYPRLEYPPETVPQLPIKHVRSLLDPTYTDIATALKLALASFPEGTGKRIVLISDGNQNLGNAEEIARILRQNGVQVDIIPVLTGTRVFNEVLVERVEAPTSIEKDARFPVRVVLRSHHPHVVAGALKLYKLDTTRRELAKDFDLPLDLRKQLVEERQVKLPLGLRGFDFQIDGDPKEGPFSLEAVFEPHHIEHPDGRRTPGLPGDRLDNNLARAIVFARGQRLVLLVEPQIGDHELLVKRLHKAKTSMRVVQVTPAQLPQNPGQLGLLLSRFDSIILANVPADNFTDEQQKILRSNTHDQGCGLVMIGGPQSFGAGSWQGTEVEKALPVTCDLKSEEIQTKGGVVLIMHASEIEDGNAWQKKIAKLAIEKLSPFDMLGTLQFDGPGHVWHIPFQKVGRDRARLFNLIDSMIPGDMPDIDPSLEKAHAALTDPRYRLGTRLIIFISDGDTAHATDPVLAKLKKANIPCTTVCITSHGQAEEAHLRSLAVATGGRPYVVRDPSKLPAIYQQEMRNLSQSYLYEEKFVPRLKFASGPTEGMKNLQPLYGFVRTTPRPGLAGTLVQVPIESPKIDKTEYPLLAYWHYGLGKSVAFTSDASSDLLSSKIDDKDKDKRKGYWDKDWAGSPMYGPFWEQTVDWSLRATEQGNFLTMHAAIREGKVHVVIDARDAQKKPLTDLRFESGVTSPDGGGDARRRGLRFEQTNSGTYEAEFPAHEVGAYWINVKAFRPKVVKDENGQETTKDEFLEGVRGGVDLPYSPEFADLESNQELLERLRDITGGKMFADDPDILTSVARSGELYRPLPVSHRSRQPIWMWLVTVAGILLFLDVAVRRIALDPDRLTASARALWAKLRGKAETAAPQFLERLRSRKAQVGETLDKAKAGQRYEGTATEVPPVATTASPPAPRPVATPPSTVESKEDFAARLLRAKKRALEDRDKKNES
jgi:uncharacterized membrane protein